MNFDELKSDWEKDGSENVRIPKSLEKLKLAKHPVEKLKRNMRNELYPQIIAILALGFVPQLANFQSSLYSLYYISYAMMVVISAYYLYGFYQFYKHMHQYTAAAKDGLFELYYELRLSMERYKSFGFLLLPFGIIWIGLYLYTDLLIKNTAFEALSNSFLLIGISIIILFTAAMIISINTWVNSFYGKYTKQIRNILDELKEE